MKTVTLAVRSPRSAIAEVLRAAKSGRPDNPARISFATARVRRRVLTAKRAHPSTDTAPLEREINARVHRLYALTPADIQLVEEATK